ncbi:ribbon-helix-helix domain-containing protein [Archaeoglobus profundus]|uniref:Transcriptional regulators, CopG/Arc/MetJ family n=1 Tax=Archaeoglobus profundus (strain DSM 5631 / JCM 9629 / NBRC 100127 / Av18) TaxID=572546 RepID=D2RFA2_ARCPA|nr:ribbon-helix-helix domain-containing protein [Archaeoglobus profundus]ADB58796.1 putative transcriptional regulators, CopG/Arc/MetJ family [Archaeoglobus profundus DSM 5631]
MTWCKPINVKIALRDHSELQKFVNEGKYLSVSDAVREAIRLLIFLEKNDLIVLPSGSSRHPSVREEENAEEGGKEVRYKC